MSGSKVGNEYDQWYDAKDLSQASELVQEYEALLRKLS
jgi:hypothetical protein